MCVCGEKEKEKERDRERERERERERDAEKKGDGGVHNTNSSTYRNTLTSQSVIVLSDVIRDVCCSRHLISSQNLVE